MILSQEEKIKLLEEKKRNSQIELESREQTAEITNESHEKKLKELENFIKNPEKAVTPAQMFEFDSKQKLELLTLQENLQKKKKELDKHRIKEIKYKLGLIKTKIFAANKKLNLIKRTASDIK
ncbi:hypothetical protein ACFLYU_05115, partial [Candidatus Dependentiae bacterium]